MSEHSLAALDQRWEQGRGQKAEEETEVHSNVTTIEKGHHLEIQRNSKVKVKATAGVALKEKKGNVIFLPGLKFNAQSLLLSKTGVSAGSLQVSKIQRESS